MSYNCELLYAGPGCGKTTLLLNRYTANHDCSCILTFSRKTAQELRERSGSRLAKTFHSLAYEIVKSMRPNVVVVPHPTSNSNFITFDQMMKIALENVDLIANTYNSFYIDEFQDLDPTQMKLVLELSKRNCKIIGVGDPNQSIYGWRNSGCNPFEMAKQNKFKMEVGSKISYRLPQYVANAANNLIKRNKTGIKEKIASYSKDKTPIDIMEFDTDIDKAKAILEYISSIRESILILFRTNAEAEYFLSLPPFENVIITKAYTTALNEAQNNAAVLLQLYKSSITDIKALKRFLSKSTSDYNADALLRFMQSEQKDIKSFIKILNLTGQPNIADVLEPFIDLSIEEAILAIDDLPYRYDATISHNCRIMTLHGSKGLEADTVIVDMNSAFMPIPGAFIEEERRLAYVGITRSKRKLVVMFSHNMMTNTLLPVQSGPSTFIRECGIKI